MNYAKGKIIAAPSSCVRPAMANNNNNNGNNNNWCQIEANSRIRISLQDTSRMDAPASDIGVQEILTSCQGKSFPIQFSVPFESYKIVPGRRYAISVRVTQTSGAGTLTWVSMTYNEYRPGVPQTITIQRVRS
ncbi:hypothetical protein DFQ27_005935 [Actinomortierella ambigua]|uniref:Uncharacterized protein n=1 Tax=Actinomortierella ambigua TaxID=1343610 RepID=A0A9P6Q0R9_9FUNG|nr:hypothetical protein DFQ27_005935 [Actinomortierella ambigua]